MTLFFVLAATALGLAASVAFYLSAASQRLMERRLALPVSLGTGFILSAIALSLLRQVSGPAASVFILMTLIMGAWSGLPFLMAWLKPGRSKRT